MPRTKGSSWPDRRRRLPGVAALLVLAGCDSVVGLTPPGQADAGSGGASVGVADGCGGLYEAGACGSCVAASCCAAARACADSSTCRPYAQCLASCAGDPACRSQCTLDDVVRDDPSVASLDACVATSCAGSCGLSCGGFAELVSEPAVAAACEQCVGESGLACMLSTSCATSAACDAYVHCRRACVTGDCIGACGNDPADGELYSPAYAQIETDCLEKCGARDQWSCVGHVAWPAVTSPKRALTVTVVDASDGSTPIAGATVNLCNPLNSCAPPVGTGVTDSTGLVTVVDGTAAVNGADYGLEGFLDISQPGFVPTRVYWGFPLSAPAGRLGEPILLFSWSDLEKPAALAGISLDATEGQVAAVVLDCFGYQAVGVTGSLTAADGSAVQALYRTGGTSLAPALTTDDTGSLFFFNVPPGSATLRAAQPASGRTTATVTVDVRAGALTLVGMGPTP